MDIAKLRKDIDKIDEQILELINERCKRAIEIGKRKKSESIAIYAPEREKKLIARLEKINRGPIRAKALRAIYKQIITGARELENRLNTLNFKKSKEEK